MFGLMCTLVNDKINSKSGAWMEKKRREESVPGSKITPPPPHRQQLKKDAFLTILAHQPVYSEGRLLHQLQTVCVS